MVFEVIRIDTIEGCEIPLHVGEEYRHINDLLPALASVFQDVPDVPKDGMTLSFDIIRGDVALAIEFDTGDLRRAAFTRTDARKEEEISYSSCVRVWPYRFGRVVRVCHIN